MKYTFIVSQKPKVPMIELMGLSDSIKAKLALIEGCALEHKLTVSEPAQQGSNKDYLSVNVWGKTWEDCMAFLRDIDRYVNISVN